MAENEREQIAEAIAQEIFDITEISEIFRGIAHGKMLHPDILVAAAIVKADRTMEKLLANEKVLSSILKDIQASTDRIAAAIERKGVKL